MVRACLLSLELVNECALSNFVDHSKSRSFPRVFLDAVFRVIISYILWNWRPGKMNYSNADDYPLQLWLHFFCTSSLHQETTASVFTTGQYGLAAALVRGVPCLLGTLLTERSTNTTTPTDGPRIRHIK